MILDLAIINAIVVILIDLLGVAETFFARPIFKWLTKGKMKYNGWCPKPFCCSLCTSFWLGLLYIILVGRVSLLNILIVLVLAYFNFIIGDVIIWLKELWANLNEKIIKRMHE